MPLIQRMAPPASRMARSRGSGFPPLTGAGYTVFVPNHRGTPTFHYPDPVQDIQRAIPVRPSQRPALQDRLRIPTRWVRGIFGRASHRVDGIDGRQGRRRQRAIPSISRAQSCKRSSCTQRLWDLNHGTGRRLSWRVAADSAADTEKPQSVGQTVPEASPISHVTADDPPGLLLAGDADTNVPLRHAMALHAALQKVHVPSKVTIIPRGTHGPTRDFLAAGAARPAHWPDPWRDGGGGWTSTSKQ